MTRGERNALRIVSVRATGAEASGLMVTAQFAGNVEQALGRGHLRHALVALVLLSKTSKYKTSALATTGPGAIGQTLAETRSTDVGVARNGRTLTFFIGGSGLSNVKRIEVKAFAAMPTGRRARAAAGLPQSIWDHVEQDLAADEARLSPPSEGTSCSELVGMLATLSALLDKAHQRDSELKKLKDEIEQHDIPSLEGDLASHQWLHAAALTVTLGAGLVAPVLALTGVVAFVVNPLDWATVVVGGAFISAADGLVAVAVKFLREPRNQKDEAQLVRDEIRALKLDAKLADAYRDKNQQLIGQIIAMQRVVRSRYAENCAPVPQLKPLTAIFYPEQFTTVYTESASEPNYDAYFFTAYLEPNGFVHGSHPDEASNPDNGQQARFDYNKQQWIDSTGAAITPSAALRYTWAVSIPADPMCGLGFTGNKPFVDQASWYHADESQGGPCNHGGVTTYNGSGSGHPGTVAVLVRNGFWSCAATYYGTQGSDGTTTGAGPTPQKCQSTAP